MDASMEILAMTWLKNRQTIIHHTRERKLQTEKHEPDIKRGGGDLRHVLFLEGVLQSSKRFKWGSRI